VACLHTVSIHRRFIYKGITHTHTHTHAEGTDPTGGLSERGRVRRHYGLLCSTLVAAKSGSICIASSHRFDVSPALSIALPGWHCHVPGREFGAAAVGQSILVFYF